MLNTAETQAFADKFPILTDNPEVKQLIVAEGAYKLGEAGQQLTNAGQYIKALPLVISGSIKVLRGGYSEHELFLYYLQPGETCAMALSCCGLETPSELSLWAEQTSTFVLLPASTIQKLEPYHEWKTFVSQTYSARFLELLNTIDSIAFLKMDERLADLLEIKARQLKTRNLTQTHQELASELGTSREVVSRLLKQMEHRGFLKLGRNAIELR